MTADLAPLGFARHMLRSFAYRDYRLLWFHSVCLHLGRQTWELIQSWQLLQLTNSPAMVGLGAALWRLPTFVCEPLGGVLADRTDRRRLMAATMIPYLPILLLLGLSAQAGWMAAWQVLAANFAAGVCSALYRPSRQALLPNLVPREALVNAVALGASVQYMGMAAGPLTAGLLMAALGVSAAYYVDTAIYALGVLLLLWLHLPRALPPTQGPWASFAAGLRYVAGDPRILALLILQSAVDLFSQSYTTLMPVLVRNEFGAGAEALGLLLTLSGVGSGLGIALVASLRLSTRSGGMVLASALAYSGLTVLLASLSDFGLALAVVAVAGAGYGLLTTLTAGLLQLLVDDSFRGRVMSTSAVSHMGAAFVGNLLLGAAASAVGVRTTLMVAASLAAAVTLAVAGAVPALRRG